MSRDSNSSQFVELYVRPLQQHWLLWVTPTVVVTALALLYAFLGPKQWMASQQVVVRNESLGTPMSPGRFESYDEMKTIEETIHAVAKNRHVAISVLQQLPPPEGRKPSSWPSQQDVDDFLDSVAVAAPNGAVFGQTEVLHVNVNASSPQRAIAATTALCIAIEQRLNEIRSQRSASLERELVQAVAHSNERLGESTARLTEIENELGVDLSELRNLDQQFSGSGGVLQQELGRVRESLRRAQQELATIELQRGYLHSVANDPDGIVTVPGALLISYPALGRLKNGLTDAELRLAKSLSQYDETHPRTVSVREEVDQIRTGLRQEIQTALAEADFNARAKSEEIRQFEENTASLETRISRITTYRVEYNQLVAEVEQRKKDVATMSSQLSEVQASKHASRSSSIISRVDEPVVGTRPIGPGKKFVAAGGLIAGLAIGIGLVFLVSPARVMSGDNLLDGHATVARESAHATQQIERDVPEFFEVESRRDDPSWVSEPDHRQAETGFVRPTRATSDVPRQPDRATESLDPDPLKSDVADRVKPERSKSNTSRPLDSLRSKSEAASTDQTERSTLPKRALTQPDPPSQHENQQRVDPLSTDIADARHESRAKELAETGGANTSSKTEVSRAKNAPIHPRRADPSPTPPFDSDDRDIIKELDELRSEMRSKKK